MSGHITRVIENADLLEFNTCGGGDCVNIAVALREVYGGEYVASYANAGDFREGEPAHFGVRIDGTLYDGNGETSKEALRECAYGGSGQNGNDIIVRTVSEPEPKLHDPSRVQTIIDRLQAAQG